MTSNETRGDLVPVLALTREIPNYVERVSQEIGCSEGDLWSIYLAATGSMFYPEQREAATFLPDGEMRPGGITRYRVWHAALLHVLEILGPIEARLRTGYEAAELRSAIAGFFDVTPGSMG